MFHSLMPLDEVEIEENNDAIAPIALQTTAEQKIPSHVRQSIEKDALTILTNVHGSEAARNYGTLLQPDNTDFKEIALALQEAEPLLRDPIKTRMMDKIIIGMVLSIVLLMTGGILWLDDRETSGKITTLIGSLLLIVSALVCIRDLITTRNLVERVNKNFNLFGENAAPQESTNKEAKHHRPN